MPSSNKHEVEGNILSVINVKLPLQVTSNYLFERQRTCKKCSSVCVREFTAVLSFIIIQIKLDGCVIYDTVRVIYPGVLKKWVGMKDA